MVLSVHYVCCSKRESVQQRIETPTGTQLHSSGQGDTCSVLSKLVIITEDPTRGCSRSMGATGNGSSIVNAARYQVC